MERAVCDIGVSLTREGSHAGDRSGVARQVEDVDAATEHRGRRAVTQPRVCGRVVEEQAKQVVCAHGDDVPRGVGGNRLATRRSDAAVPGERLVADAVYLRLVGAEVAEVNSVHA